MEEQCPLTITDGEFVTICKHYASYKLTSLYILVISAVLFLDICYIIMHYFITDLL